MRGRLLLLTGEVLQGDEGQNSNTVIPLFATKFSRTDLQGRWAEELDGSIYCSNCGNTSEQSSNYCSVCGARMKEWAVIDKSNC